MDLGTITGRSECSTTDYPCGHCDRCVDKVSGDTSYVDENWMQLHNF